MNRYEIIASRHRTAQLHKTIIFCAVLLLASLRSAHAVPYMSDQFLPGPINVTFDEENVPPGQMVTTQYASLGVTFGGSTLDGLAAFTSAPNNFEYQSVLGDVGIPNEDADALTNFTPVSSAAPFQINFLQPVSSAVFALGSLDGFGDIHLIATLNGQQVEGFDTGASLTQTDNVFGFTNSDFDSIVGLETNNHTGNVVIDNLQFTPIAVPEPGSLSLLCLGLLVLQRQVSLGVGGGFGETCGGPQERL
jgi:hypothetical protein